MVAKLIVVDWNGTLFGLPDDNDLVRQLLKAVFRASVSNVLKGRPGDLAVLGRFGLGRLILKRVKRRYDKGESGLGELYEPINRLMLRGAPISLIEETADAFGARHTGLLDKRMLLPLVEAHESGAHLAILSAAYDRGIHAVLDTAGISGAFDELACNILEQDGERALGLTKRFRDDKAGDFKSEFLDRQAWSPSEIIYAGDNSVDEPIAALLPRGHFIVPFLASSAFKGHMSATHGA